MRATKSFGLLTLVLAAACGARPEAVAPGAPSASAAPAPSAPAASDEDREPKLTRRTGKAKAERLPAAAVKARAVHAKAGHLFVAVPLDLRDQNEMDTAVRVDGDRPSFGVVARVGAGSEILLRLVGEAPPSAPLRLRWASAAPRQSGSYVRGGKLQELTVTLAGASRDATLERTFYQGAAQWMSFRGGLWNSPGEPFYSFSAARLEQLMHGGKQPAGGGVNWAVGPRTRAELDQLMGLYTGMMSVREALQTDRGLATSRQADKRTLDPSGITGVPLPAHPWPRMISELPGAPKPVIEPLAASVPADMLYVHFHDVRTMIGLLSDLEGWVSPLAQSLEHASGFKSFGDRYDDELGIQRTGIAEKIGHVAVDGVALAASDPLLREGTDVSLVFRVKNKTLLLTALDAMLVRAKSAHPGAQGSSFTVHGKKVEVVASPDGVLRQHRLELGEVLVLSNSKGAISRFAEVAAKKRPALAESGDYRYMRARYPFDPKAEDGFVFAGDALIGAVTSPRFKILSARRMLAGADLEAASHATLLFGWLEGRRPKDVAELVKSGLLRRDELRHAGGAAISLDLATGARSAWGSPARLTSIIDLELGKVSAEEKAAYERFRSSYQQNWRGYIDPIAARVRRSPDGKKLAVDVRILPLIDQTEYDDVARQVGKATVSLPPLGAGVRWVLAIGKDAEIRREGDRLAHNFVRKRDLAFGWVGDWVAAGTGDRNGLWDVALASGVVPEVGERRDLDDFGPSILNGLPLYFMVHVKSRIGLAAALTAARAFVEDAAPGTAKWEQAPAYRGIEITLVRAKENERQRQDVELSYCIANDVLIASLDRHTLERQIDAVLDGKAPKSSDRGEVQTAIELRPDRADGPLARALAGLVESEALTTHRRAALGFEALARGFAAELPSDPAGRRQAALAWLGYEPGSPQGGEFSLGPDGFVTHSLYGTGAEPVVPESFDRPGAVSDVLKQLDRASFSVAFEGEGAHRGLHAAVAWDRR